MPVLPFDILAIIFQIGVKEEFHNSINEPLLSPRHQKPFAWCISQVCHSWREISRSIPGLWATIPYYESYSAHLVDESLKLSRDSLLDIKLYAGWRSSDSPPSNIGALERNLHRIRTLYATTHSSIPNSDFQKLLEGPLPNLRTLVLSHGLDAQNAGDHCAFFLEHPWTGIPFLTTFVSFRCSVDLTSPTFSQLQTLEIHGIPPRSSLTISGWLNSLRHMSSLQRLSISQSISLDPSETTLVVEMPHLRVIRFSGYFAVLGLLSQLYTPRLEELDLGLICGDPSNIFVPEKTIKHALHQSLHNWKMQLAECTLGLRLTCNHLVIQTLSSPQFPSSKKSAHFLVELTWTLSGTTLHDIDVIVDSIGKSFQPVLALATQIDAFFGGGVVCETLTPSHLSAPLRRSYWEVDQIIH